jgi:hypothetical protein
MILTEELAYKEAPATAAAAAGFAVSIGSTRLAIRPTAEGFAGGRVPGDESWYSIMIMRLCCLKPDWHEECVDASREAEFHAPAVKGMSP